jgi:aspartyl-tRNA(Asn)/glutamyl-tRNA(Gln) amidotransferase subunit A
MSDDPADLGVVDAAALIAQRELSSVEITNACLARIRARDGVHSHAGDPRSVNAWVRVYEESALTAAAHADAVLAERSGDAGPPPPLWGVPIGLKDLYAVRGAPLTASSRLLDEQPDADCDAWARLAAQGMILLGHLHTHEFAVGATTDQVGNPWALERSAGGSSGGSAAALAARMVPAATGTDTAGSLRIPSALCGTSTIKPTRGLVSLRGVVPLAASLDHAGPMARSLADCAPLLAAMAGPDAGRPPSALAEPAPAVLPAARAGVKPLAGVRLAISPRRAGAELDPDVADGFDAALAQCRALGAELVEPAPPAVALEGGDDFLDVFYAELIVYHRRFDARRADYRPSLREWVEQAEARAVSAERYVAAQTRRRETTATLAAWLAGERIAALLEPTVPCVAPVRGDGYERAGSDYALISLTAFWDWTGFPVVALPAGVGARSGLPVSVSLIGAAGGDWELLDIGIQLQAALGVPVPAANSLD